MGMWEMGIWDSMAGQSALTMRVLVAVTSLGSGSTSYAHARSESPGTCTLQAQQKLSSRAYAHTTKKHTGRAGTCASHHVPKPPTTQASAGDNFCKKPRGQNPACPEPPNSPFWASFVSALFATKMSLGGPPGGRDLSNHLASCWSAGSTPSLATMLGAG